MQVTCVSQLLQDQTLHVFISQIITLCASEAVQRFQIRIIPHCALLTFNIQNQMMQSQNYQMNASIATCCVSL